MFASFQDLNKIMTSTGSNIDKQKSTIQPLVFLPRRANNS